MNPRASNLVIHSFDSFIRLIHSFVDEKMSCKTCGHNLKIRCQGFWLGCFKQCYECKTYADCFERQGCECKVVRMAPYTRKGLNTVWEIDCIGPRLTKLVLSYVPMITHGTDSTIRRCISAFSRNVLTGDPETMNHPLMDAAQVSRVVVADKRTRTFLVERTDGKALTLLNIYQELRLIPTGRWSLITDAKYNLMAKLEVISMQDFERWINVNSRLKYQIPITDSYPHWIRDESSLRHTDSGLEPYNLTRRQIRNHDQ